MTQEQLQSIARKQPFSPFRIILATGATYDIRHSDLIMVGKRSATIGITNEPEGAVYDYSLFIDLLHIVGIQELALTKPTSNGPVA